jgi:hypothetical protein
MCTVTLNYLKNVLKASTQAGQAKQEKALTVSTVKVAKKNFFAPLRTTNLDHEARHRVQLSRGSSSRKIGYN